LKYDYSFVFENWPSEYLASIADETPTAGLSPFSCQT
jgi:hypothetical protein